MATNNGQITVNNIKIIESDSEPITGGGLAAEQGSFAVAKNGDGSFYKFGAGNTDWIKTNDPGFSDALNSANIFVGNGSNIATGVTMSGEATIDNTGAITLSNAAVIAKVLTGFTSVPGVVAATDSILEAIEKIVGNQLVIQLALPDAVVAPSGGDYTTLAAAVAAESAGAEIKIKPGTYAETADIDVKSDMIIQGSGMDKTILDMTGNEVLFGGTSIAGSGTISITGTAVTGVGSNLTTFAVGDKIVYNSQIYTLATITDAVTATIEENVGNTSGALAFYGLDVSGTPANVIFRDLTFTVNSTAFGWLFRMDGALRARFERCRFDAQDNVGQGIYRMIGCFDCTFVDCINENSDQRTIRHENRNIGNTWLRTKFKAATFQDQVILRSEMLTYRDCDFQGTALDCINIGNIGPINGINFYNNKFSNIGQHAIRYNLSSIEDGVCSIVGNEFSDCGRSAIYIDDGGGKTSITGNIIQGCSNASFAGIQIENEPANTDITIVGNTIIGNAGWGIDINHTGNARVTIVGNNLNNNTSGAVSDLALDTINLNNQT